MLVHKKNQIKEESNISWEEISKKQVKCPCGKGIVELVIYGDDWNRCEKSISIECYECKQIYDVVKNDHSRPVASDGNWTEYTLIKKEYSESKYAYMQNTVIPDDVPFYAYLIKAYLKNDLVGILEEYQSITRVKDLRVISKKVAKNSKKGTGSAIRENIIEILRMHWHIMMRIQKTEKHLQLMKKCKQKQEKYLEEREKHLIKLDF